MRKNGKMLTVWSVCTGHKYSPEYVYELQRKVEQHLDEPHEFVCLTEHEFSGINCIEPKVLYNGWWNKMQLFQLATGRSLFFDLDVVITGSLDYLVPYTRCKLAAPMNWAQSGHGGIQSSVMAWSGELQGIYDWFEKDANVYQARLWGDQEFLTEYLDDDEWTRIPYVGSYKYHCRQGLPLDLRVIVFHGKPDPHEVKDEWILPFTSTLNSRIKSSTRNDSHPDFQSMV